MTTKTKTPIKLFLIDPFTHKVEEIESTTDFETLYKVMQCDMIRPLYGAFVGTNDVLYLDEEGNFKKNNPPFMTPHGAYVGRAIVLSVVRGKEASPTIALAELKAQVFFPPKR